MAQLSIAGTVSDAKTLEAAVAGDVEALARIVAAYHDDMARIAFVICGDEAITQDAVQSAWLIAWRKLSTVRQPHRLRQWLMAIAANEARQIARRSRSHVVLEIAVADVPMPASDPSSRATALDLGVALRRLSPDDRAILSLRHLGGYDATEIGRALGMRPASVRTRLARTLARLRKDLEDD